MDSQTISSWGAIATSVLTLLTFAGTLVIVFFFKDSGMLNLMVGAVIANATTAVNFWLGSSSGSQKKDDALARAALPPGGSNSH